jgi:uncharacterized iron-regulated membrane protein
MIRSITGARPVSRAALRKAWLQFHRWTALGLGWILVLSGFLGAILVVAKPLDRWANSALFESPAIVDTRAPAASLESIRQSLLREFGPSGSYTFRPPRTPKDTTWVFVRGPWEGVVYFDPASGRELGRRGESEGAFNLIFELHSSLLMGDAGKAVLTSAAGAYLVMLASGLYLWWPVRWPPLLRIRINGPLLRTVFDLHSIGGALLGVAILVSVASGAYMAWPPLRGLVSTIAGTEIVQPPKLKLPANATVSDPLTLDEFVARAQAIFPQGRVGYVLVPADPAKPLRVRLKLPDDPHPNGMTSVWLDPFNGNVVAVNRWHDLDPGHAVVSVIYPLHTGELGGVLLEVVTAVIGLSLGTLGATGLWLWWKRRRPPRSSP